MVFDQVQSLTQRVISGELTLQEAVRRIVRSPAPSDQTGVLNCVAAIEEISHQDPKFALTAARLLEPLARWLDDPHLEARCLLLVGRLAGKAGEPELGVNRLRLARRRYQQLGGLLGQSLAERGLGDIDYLTRQYDRALKHFASALDLDRQLGDDRAAANTLMAMGEALRFQYRLAEAAERYAEALALYRRSGADLGAANALHALGGLLNFQYRLDESITYYQQALLLYRQLRTPLGQGNALYSIAGVLRYRGEYDQALAHYREAIESYRIAHHGAGVARCLNGIGDLHWMRFELPEAKAFFQQALAQYRQMGDRRGEASVERDIGYVYRYEMDSKQAMHHFQTALELSRKLNDPHGQAAALELIGDVLRHRLEYDRAQEAYEAALELYRAVQDYHGEATALRGLGDIASFRFEYLTARTYHEAAVDLFAKTGDAIGEAATWESIGDWSLDQGDLAGALKAYESALALHRSAANRQGESSTLQSISNALCGMGEPDRALERLQEALALCRQTGDLLGTANALRITGDAWRARPAGPDRQKALTAYRQALAAHRKAGSLVGLIETTSALGGLLLELGNNQEAYRLLRRTGRFVEESHGRQWHEGARRAVSNRDAVFYQTMVRACLVTNRAEEAWLWAERAKGRVLLDLLGSASPRLTTSKLRAAYKAWDCSARRLLAYEEHMRRQPAAPPVNPADRLPQLREAEQTHRRHLVRLLEDGRELVQVSVPRPRHLARWLGRLAEHGAGVSGRRPLLVEYFWLGPERYVVFLLPLWDRSGSAGGLPLYTRAGRIAPDRLNRLTNSFREALTASRTGLPGRAARGGVADDGPPSGTLGEETVLSFFADLPKELGELLVQPWADLLSILAPTDLVVIPHGVLHTLPLHAALADGHNTLLDRFNVVYLPNAALARTLVRRAPGRSPARARLVMGPPYAGELPFAEAESAEIAGLWGQGRPFRFSRMKTSVLRRYAGQVGFLHLATHSRFDARDYLRSHIEFHDEQLTVAQLVSDGRFNLQGLQLCYLSSCDSGQVHGDLADNLQGLVWALVHAGAQAAMASLWLVNDKAARHVAERFYFYLSRGEIFAGAYRQAVNDLRQEPEFSNPYFWAPFVLAGAGFQGSGLADSTKTRRCRHDESDFSLGV